MVGLSGNEMGINPLEKGRHYYHKRKYQAALEAFSEATELCTGSLKLTALDYRAAAYEKLGQLQAALKDSKEMIELAPDRAKGYLRCGKILQLKEEKDLAMKIYERGLRKVKIGTDEERTGLQSIFNKLRRSMNPGAVLDPITFLPLELIHMIFEYLSTKDKVICLAVSKPWNKLLVSSPKLWTTFNTLDKRAHTFITGGRSRRPISLFMFRLYLKRSNYALHTAVISGKDSFDGTKMELLTRLCKDLRHLELHGFHLMVDSLVNALPFAQNLRTLIVSNRTTAKTMLKALQLCSQTLVKAAFLSLDGTLDATQAWPMLESLECLDIRNGPTPMWADLNALLQSVPNVKELTLVDCDSDRNAERLDLSGCKHLEYLRIRTLSTPRVPIFPSTLKHLDLQGNGYMNSETVPEGETFDLPFLESLDCSLTSKIDVSLIKRLMAKSNAAGRLKRLCIGGRYQDDGKSNVEDMYPASSSVTELSISSIASNCVKEDRILAVLALFPNVRILDLSNNQYVTGVSVRQFVLQGMTHLNLVNCPKISPDAIQWAESEDVIVEHKPNVQRMGNFRSWRDSMVDLRTNY